ncbi:hypothetical protein E2320_000339 [Naja naja]|nr:hypothetical protein E2320_000339 [Naja naja]
MRLRQSAAGWAGLRPLSGQAEKSSSAATYRKGMERFAFSLAPLRLAGLGSAHPSGWGEKPRLRPQRPPFLVCRSEGPRDRSLCAGGGARLFPASLRAAEAGNCLVIVVAQRLCACNNRGGRVQKRLDGGIAGEDGERWSAGKWTSPTHCSLGIGPYNWNTECLLANATATEVRAKHNYFDSTGYYGDHTGLSCFSPVLNIMRHPLWGRNQETYGEDPFLTTQLGIAFVKGLQGDHPRYIKANAGCKHFDVHGGPENIPVSRFFFDAKVEERDWRMTFLPQFEASQAGTFSFMCSYNRINGVPACANKKLLTDILRDEWGFQGYVVAMKVLWS